MISTVDPEARHGHETAPRGFDGYEGHLAIDPEREIVTATAGTAANAGDGSVAEELFADRVTTRQAEASEPAAHTPEPAETVLAESVVAGNAEDVADEPAAPSAQVYGDASYGSGEVLEKLEHAGIEANVEVMPPTSRAGCFTQEALIIERTAGTATCPAGAVARLGVIQDGQRADFSAHMISHSSRAPRISRGSRCLASGTRPARGAPRPARPEPAGGARSAGPVGRARARTAPPTATSGPRGARASCAHARPTPPDPPARPRSTPGP